MKKYMIIEQFKKNKIKLLYQRFEEKGRLLPEGVKFIDSWVDENVEVCYQLMESESPERIQQWINHWNDLVDFEVIPVISSGEAKAKVFNKAT